MFQQKIKWKSSLDITVSLVAKETKLEIQETFLGENNIGKEKLTSDTKQKNLAQSTLTTIVVI